jgi:hypothetical protein
VLGGCVCLPWGRLGIGRISQLRHGQGGGLWVFGPMARYAFIIEYSGAPFHGWQRQAGGLPSVQGAVEAALARLDPLAPALTGAGRTDTGFLPRDWHRRLLPRCGGGGGGGGGGGNRQGAGAAQA